MIRIICAIFAFSIFSSSLTAQQLSNDSKKPTDREVASEQDLHYRHLYFFALASEESRQKQLDISPSQLAKIKIVEKTFWKELEEVGKLRDRPLNKESYERLRKTIEQAENSVKEKFNTSVENILLPHQLDRIDLYARRRRMMSIRDEFEVPILLAKEKGMPNSEIRELERHIQEVRKKFYASLNEARDRRSKLVLNSMDKEVRRNFERQYKELYDFRAEEATELIGEPIK